MCHTTGLFCVSVCGERYNLKYVAEHTNLASEGSLFLCIIYSAPHVYYPWAAVMCKETCLVAQIRCSDRRGLVKKNEYSPVVRKVGCRIN